MKKVLIIGAGLAGLSTAYALKTGKAGHAITVLEKEDRPGGLCRTEETGGFLFDRTGHLLHIRTQSFRAFVFRMLSGQMNELQRRAWIYSHDVFTRYPFQANLFGLPPKVVTECLYGYCKAVFKLAKVRVHSFEDWILSQWGPGIADHFMIPYNTKLYGRPPSELSPECAGRFMPTTDPLEVIRGAVSPSSDVTGYNATFYYPKQGGIESLIKAILHKGLEIRTNQEVRSIDLKEGSVETTNGTIYDFDRLVSSAPLPELIRMVEEVPLSVRKAAASLEYVSVMNINLGVRGKIEDKHWIYIPERRYTNYRVGFADNFTDRMAPPGCSSIYTEISYQPGQAPDLKQSVEKVVSDLISMKLIRKNSDIISRMVIDIPHAYVIFNPQREKALRIIQGFLKKRGVLSIGRFGRWAYTSMEDAFLDGLAAAAEIYEI